MSLLCSHRYALILSLTCTFVVLIGPKVLSSLPVDCGVLTLLALPSSPLFNFSTQCPFQIFLLQPFQSPFLDLHCFYPSLASRLQAPSSPPGSSISGIH